MATIKTKLRRKLKRLVKAKAIKLRTFKPKAVKYSIIKVPKKITFDKKLGEIIPVTQIKRGDAVKLRALNFGKFEGTVIVKVKKVESADRIEGEVVDHLFTHLKGNVIEIGSTATFSKAQILVHWPRVEWMNGMFYESRSEEKA